MIRRKKRIERGKDFFGIRKKYFESFKFLKSIDNYLAMSFALFLFLFAFGFLAFFILPDSILNYLLEFVSKWIKELLEQTEGKGFFEMWWYIFANNLSIGFFSAFLGIFLGIPTLFFLFFNGAGIGFVSGIVANEENLISLLTLLPHGVFEIPAILISFALGIKLGYSPILRLIKTYYKNADDFLIALFFILLFPLIVIFSLPLFIIAAVFTMNNFSLRKKFLHDLASSIQVFFLIVAPLFIIAAIIESALIVFWS
ncbi:MAG: stage II sporulation protein M [Candidatus Pacearchaeota archaeon]